MVKIIRGLLANVELQFITLKDCSRSYCIHGEPENVPGVSYPLSPKDWMESEI